MKKRWKRLVMIVGTMCMMSLAVYGCGDKAGTETRESGQTELPQDTAEDSGQAEGAASDEKEAQGESGQPESSSSGDEESKGASEPEDSIAGQEELKGDIQKIGEGTFTVAEIYQETMDDGSELMVVGAPGNEEDMNLITVVYDKDTVFWKRTIRNGGADYEDSEATSDDLAVGFTAEMVGSYEGEEFHASRIKLVEVIL